MAGRQSPPRDKSQRRRGGWGRTAVRSHPKQSPVSASLLYTLYTNWQGKTLGATTVADVLRRTGQRRERGFKNRRTLRAFFATKRRLLLTCVTTSDVFCNKVYVIRKFWNNFLDKENKKGGAKNLVFQFRGISICSKGNGQIDGRATVDWSNVAQERRREQAKHQPRPPRSYALVARV